MKAIAKHADWVIFLLGIMWAIQILNFLLGYQLNQFGILPRSPMGLTGLITAPFLHGSFTHIILNSVPFFVLSLLVLMNGLNRYLNVTFMLAVFGGLAVWVFARPGYHVGASGLIFGYFGYLLSYGIFNRKFMDLLIAIVVFVAYGGMVWGVLPMKTWVSWEAHLFSMLVGLVLGKVMARR